MSIQNSVCIQNSIFEQFYRYFSQPNWYHPFVSIYKFIETIIPVLWYYEGTFKEDLTICVT
jgi:hypothetical protein